MKYLSDNQTGGDDGGFSNHGKIMKHVLHFGLVIMIITLFPCFGKAQNLEEISLEKGLKLNGSINLNTMMYHVKGLDQRRDPFNWFLTGSLNVQLFGHSTPLSFSYSNASRSFSQPYNRFSFSPQYKWVKTYIGYNSMSFSPYTLSGHVFLGGGVELRPGKWNMAVMYGRLRKAVPFNTIDTLQYTDASFRRMGYGIKVGYETGGESVSANIFTAKDQVNSIPFIVQESGLTPQQNVAASISGKKKLLRRFFIQGEYALSTLNRNTGGNLSDSTTAKQASNLIGGLLPENSTSSYFDAFNASFGYQGKGYAVQFKYERVAPEYQTLGAYYFNNDMKNITIAPSVKLLNSKLSLSGNVGVQQNNLDNTRTSTTRRTVAAVNANYVPSQKWNLAGSYSNFNSFTNVRPQADPFFRDNLDTLNFFQVSQTFNGTVTRSFGSKDNPQTVMLNASYQEASDESGYEGGDSQSNFLTANASYSYTLTPINATFAVAVNTYANSVAGVESRFFGPTLSASKPFLEKTMRISYSSSYNQTTSGKIQTSPVWSNQFSASYSPKKAEDSFGTHNLSLSVSVVSRLKTLGEQKKYTETTASFNYSFSF